MRNLLKALLLSSLCAQVMGFQEINKNDLYEHFFNIDNNRECKKNTSCKMLRRHLKRDSKKCVMNPVEVGVVENYVLQRSQATHKNVRGTMRYLGAVPGSYGYDTYLDETGTLVIESRIHFSNLADFSESAINFMKDKLLRAANVWTDSNRYTDYPVRFSLLLETNKRNSHISAKLQDPYTRGPYFSKWSTSWGVSTLAHEFGHILGLDDEYSNNPFGGSVAGCDTRSIMCSSYGVPQDYQYYVIFRRLLCK
jgi:hypothetical protein